MKAKLPLIVGAIIVLILIAVVGAVAMKKSPANQTATSSPLETNVAAAASPGGTIGSSIAKNTLLGLMTSGVPVQCSFTDAPTDGKTKVSGTFLIASNKMHGDMTVTTEGKDQQMSMINDGSFMYIWGPAMEKSGLAGGFKMEVKPNSSDTVNSQVKQYVDQNKQLDYNCKPWIVLPNTFTPPSDVKFQDMSEMMKQMQQKMSASGFDKCAACSSLSGDAQATCKTQLGCN
jgi:hypothetical protein